MKRGSPSLKRPLIVKPLIFQLATLLIACTFFMALALRMDSGGRYTDEAITPVIARAIVRDQNGDLSVRETPELAELREKSPDLWFVAEDDTGRNVTLGDVRRNMHRFWGGWVICPMRTCAIGLPLPAVGSHPARKSAAGRNADESWVMAR